MFNINTSINASYYPGSEFTIFFKNPTNNGLFSIGITKDITEDVSYIYSPPLAWNYSPPDSSQSITFKSDGTTFNVMASGPAGWMGIGLLSVILTVVANFA